MGTKPAPSHACADAHRGRAGVGGWLRDPVLGLLADVLDDFETVRIANQNRVRQLTRTETDADGEERGFGLTLDNPAVARLAGTVAAMEKAEHEAVLNLQRAMRQHPLAAYQKRHKGVGEKQLARLLAAIGDPYWNDLHDRPRTVSELWAFCGFDVRNGQAPRRRRGQVSNWSEDARKRTWVIADKTVMMLRKPCHRPEGSDYAIHTDDCVCGKYRQLYDAARKKYEGSVHPAECVRCGPAGKPAQPGTERSAGHLRAMAIRLVAKEILKDLWIESRDLYIND